MSIRVLLADDHKITRQGLRSLLEKQTDIEVVAEAENGRAAVRLAAEVAPDVIIMDLTMPDLNGVEATRQILSQSPDIKIIALSMHSDALFVTEMLKSGAAGYLLKDCAFEELTRAIKTVIEKKTYLSPSISGVVVEDYIHRLSKTDFVDFDVISDREREVLQLMAEGNSTKQIAQKLHISVKTVETHRRQIMNKLDIHTVAELTKYAIRKGLTSLDT
ncbi:MAG: response regulator transcription factor [Sedimentisphaerales bacterium]|nr:response regulator transcription factor [Sedimentisphaerales bacterium]